MEIDIPYKNRNLKFFSEKVMVSSESFTENHLKLTYQRRLISNLDSKHKYWSRFISY